MLLNIFFFCIFLLFFIIKFYIFISFFDDVPKFRNRILTKQKREIVISNCQWNSMNYGYEIPSSSCHFLDWCTLQIWSAYD